MAYDNFQDEPKLPVKGKSKRRSEEHLPRIFRTPSNSKFLSSTLDQMIQPGVVNKLNGYVGRKTAKAFTADDVYVQDVSTSREDYQLESAAVAKDELGNVLLYRDYNDYMNSLKNYNRSIQDHNVVNEQEFYAWNPYIDWDKFTNFREYFWLPTGPQTISIAGQSTEVESTFTVRLSDNLDSYSYIFTPDGETPNPSLTLYRGVKYKFDVNLPDFPITFKSKLTTETEFDLDSSSILLYEGVDVQGLEKGIVTIELSTSAPDNIWYVAANDVNIHGKIEVKDLQDASAIDVSSEIVGMKTYTSGNGVALSNGMKIQFIGDVTPASYANKEFYVEGVGSSIKLIAEDSLDVATEFTEEITVNFDTLGFDNLPYSKALGYSQDKDYITINRSANDGNLWTRHNRWFHKSVIEASAAANNQPVSVDATAQASRPIIEFNSGIKLSNFGTQAKTSVDLVDDFTADVFSTIEGSLGYFVDGVELANGQRVMFTNDPDPLVKNRIFRVKYFTYDGTVVDDANVSGQRQITLVEESDSVPAEGETVLIKSGNKFKGTTLHYKNSAWINTQKKTAVNQAPLFDVFDENGYSFADATIYPSTTFTGTKMFSYKEGTGSNDNELGFPLSYKNITNVGDIVFQSDLSTDTFTYVENQDVKTQTTVLGYLHLYTDIDSYTQQTGWTKVDSSRQFVIRQYVYDNTFTDILIDSYVDSYDYVESMDIIVYRNNDFQIRDVDYTIEQHPANFAKIVFVKDLEKDDVILLKTNSSQLKTNTGYYEFPYSMERNPNNDQLDDFTLGEINDHVSTIVEHTTGFNGKYPGTSNLRDLGNVTANGRRFLQHSAPMNLPLYHTTEREVNLVKSIKFAKTEYSRFKREFLTVAENLGFDGSQKNHVDRILQELNKSKSVSDVFYFSDMVPYSGAIMTEHTVEDSDEIYFPLGENFDLSTPSYKASLVYLNDVQLIHGKDYTFNDEGYAVVTATKQPQDVITIYEYDSTKGNYIAPTPTKLGLYPAFEPAKFTDNTYLTPVNVIQGHDGSIVTAYDDYRDDLLLELEKRIYNNLKVAYDSTEFDILEVRPSYYRPNNISRSNIDKTLLADFFQWTKLVTVDYTRQTFNRDNRFTYNYRSSFDDNNVALPGFWREIYKYYYDTDRPHTHPWEMLGETIKPTWWEETYGEAPYTSENYLMWEDIEAGILRHQDRRIEYRDNYKRPGLINIVPVDDCGDLVSPLEIGLVFNYSSELIERPWVFGDGGPVEAAWRRHSEFPFSMLIAFALNKPGRLFAAGFDRVNQIRNKAGNLIYKPTGLRLRLADIAFPQDTTDTTDLHTSGIVNYIAEFTKTSVSNSYKNYKTTLSSIKNQLGFKLAGFTDQSKLKLILDSRTPLNKGNVFVPEENYQIIINESSPTDLINYSGVIIERRAEGFLVKGYSESRSFFLTHKVASRGSDSTINVGGVSEEFVEWVSGNFYSKGSVVRNNNSYYRTVVDNQEIEFNLNNFAKLPNLPVTGGRDAVIRTNFDTSTVTEVPYGTLFATIQEVVDFILSYESYLTSKGFVFDFFDQDIGKVLDWDHTIREFMFWTLYELSDGAVISLSPGASYLQLASNYSIVSNITTGPNDYTLLQANGTYLELDNTTINRRDNDFILYVNPDVTGAGVFYVELPMTQTEHVVLLDNETVFNDVIYDQTPGYRQERIKLLGYRTDEWTGSKNIPGFIYDDATATEWEQFKAYSIGSLVKFKQFYYVADEKIAGSNEFVESQWVKLDEKPRQGLLPNFEYKVNQFTDFYDLDSDNLDTEQQRFAQHLIGYQKRNYLENIINNSVSQYKFYQGMILEKGTVNSLSKLFDVLASSEKDSLEFHEEWAIRDGQYGAVDSFDELEINIDESKILVNPQPILLTSDVPVAPTDTVYRIRPYEVSVQTENYNNSPFPAKTVVDSYVNTAGYVHKDDVSLIVPTLDDVVGVDISKVPEGEFIWVGNENSNWNVLRHVDTNTRITNIILTANSIEITASHEIEDIAVGDVIGIHSVWRMEASDVVLADSTKTLDTVTNYEQFSFLTKVTGVTHNIVTVEMPDTEEFKTLRESGNFDGTEDVNGELTRFESARHADVNAANTNLQQYFRENTTIWLDNVGTDEWKVLENNNLFSVDSEITGPDTEDDPDFEYSKTFASVIASNRSGNVIIAGDPDNSNGRLFVYKRNSSRVGYKMIQVIEPAAYAADNQKFGASVDLSEDGKWLLVGSPNASNVKTNYKSAFSLSTDYDKDDIVSYKDRIWKAKFDLPSVTAGANFNTFSSVVQGVYTLGEQSNAGYNTPAMAIGNYAIRTDTNLSAFTDQVDHILVRAPKALYDNTITSDNDWQVSLQWNTLTYGNQNQETLAAKQPFGGTFAGINDSFISGTHGIINSVDIVVFFDNTNVTPEIGETLQTATGAGVVAYVHVNDENKHVIYLNKVSGTFNSTDSMFRTTGEFVGDFVKQLDTDGTVYSGFWMISTPSYTPTLTSTLSDTGKGLVFVDMSNDSTFGNYYYNVLDTNTVTVDSENNINSFIRTLSSEGYPNADDVSGAKLDSRWVIRAPKALTDTLSATDTVNIYVNQLANYTTGEFKDLTTIGLTTTDTNTEVTVDALWDGYIKVRFTQFDTSGQPFEPLVGQVVRDVTTGATATVQFYERDGVDITLFVSNTAGAWSKGELFSDTSELEFLAVSGSTNPVYQADRLIGDIQAVSIGSVANGIGKLIVIDTSTNIALPTDTSVTELVDAEYWFYTNRQVTGEPVSNDAPSILNSNWEQVYNIPADADGTASAYTNQGMYSVYEFKGSSFAEQGSYVTIDTQTNLHLGSNVKVRKNGDTYKAFIGAAGSGATSLPGKLYFVNNGTFNNVEYTWEFSKFKAYKGGFDETLNYRTGDVVFVSGDRDQLYKARTNLTPGAFDVNNWSLQEDYIDYVGFIPNSTNMVVINDSSSYIGSLDDEQMETFASEFDVSKNGDVVVVKVTYNNKPTAVVVYRNVQENYQLSQTVVTGDDSSTALDNTTFGLANSLGISQDGMYIAISAPLADTYHYNEGQVFIYKQVSGQFELHRTLENLSYSSGEEFGYNLDFNGDKLAISSRNGNAIVPTTLDSNSTTFDNNFTKFSYTNEYQGIVYLYEKVDDEFLLAQKIDVAAQDLVNFGKHIRLTNNNIFVGIPIKPQTDATTYMGEIYSFKINTVGSPIWSVKRAIQPTVDVNKIKEVYLYNTKTNQKITSLDYLDPFQGKIAGAADQEISYKTNDDPAMYSVATGTLVTDDLALSRTIILDPKSPWGPEQVGKVWWDLSNARFINAYQNDIVYSSQTWNTLFEGSTIDVYEWIESDYTPSAYDKLSLANNREAVRNSITGTSKYSDSAYVTKRVYDSISKTFSIKYYFWVKNKDTVPATMSRNINVKQIASYIANPVSNNLETISFLSSDRFVLNNVNKHLVGNDVALNVQFYTASDQRTNVHTQYKIVSEGLETSQPTDDIVNKWFDSLIGYDINKFPVPDPTIPTKYRYGTLSKPRQSWFVNRLEALKQLIERVNYVLVDNLIVDDKSLTALFDADLPASISEGLYDQAVDDLDDLNDIQVEKVSPAKLTPVVENGKIERVEITDAGRGYKVAPKIEVFGIGTDAEIEVTINSLGKVATATVVNKGANYRTTDTILSVRKFSVLVNNDNTIGGKWSIYERDNTAKVWNRTKKQSYDTTLYWDYTDWYATGYNNNTRIDHIVERSNQLVNANISRNEVVKINNIGTGGWLLLRRVNTTNSLDYTVDYETIGRENGTIQFSSNLYLPPAFGYDSNSFDIRNYDFLPTVELRVILNEIKDSIFVDDLLEEFNKLFFASLRYVLSEQVNVDWVFKTSFVKAKHNVGQLRKDVTFNNDNLADYEDYIKEVKPFKSKIREYLSSYERLEPTRSFVTDFDLTPVYDNTTGTLQHPTSKIRNNEIEILNEFVQDYPNKHWYDNAGYELTAAHINDAGTGYYTAPVITISGGGGSGAELKAYIGTSGKVNKVEIVNAGSGYTSAPTITLNNNLKEGGTPASISIEVGNGLVRSLKTAMKFDRTAKKFTITNIDAQETFTASGSNFEYDLKWPMQLYNSDITITANGVELLRSEYTFENVVNTDKSYKRELGRITTTQRLEQGTTVVVSYKKAIDILNAPDRIGKFYAPTTGQLDNDLTQLMTGVDYGGVEVKGVGFDQIQGWDNDAWYTSEWDAYDDTNDDEVFSFDESTVELTLSTPLETGIQYNVYLNNVRLDDPNFDGSTVIENPNAIMRTLTGDGVTDTFYLDDFKLETIQADGNNTGVVINYDSSDKLVIRKSTSDGSYALNPNSIDTELSGGNLAYGNARGILAEDITIDGEGFVTPINSGSVEEHVPGHVLDTVNIKVYELPFGTNSDISTNIHYGNGTATDFAVDAAIVDMTQVIVKVNDELQVYNTDFTVDFETKLVKFTSAPTDRAVISINNFGTSGANILDSDTFTSDGSTINVLTSATYEDDLQSIVSVNGQSVDHVIVEENNKATIVLGDPATANEKIEYTVFSANTDKNYSKVTVESLVADGSSVAYDLTTKPESTVPYEWNTVVIANNRLLDPGYVQRFTVSASTSAYVLDNLLLDITNIAGYMLQVVLNGVELEPTTQFTWEPSTGTVVLASSVTLTADTELEVYVRYNSDYSFGSFDTGNDFVADNTAITFSNTYAASTDIKVVTFTNHDHKNIEWQRIQVKDRDLTEGTAEYARLSNIQRGKIELDSPAYDSQYVWVSKNGVLLVPNGDYYLDNSKQIITLANAVAPDDEFIVVHFAADPLIKSFGWQQFKDILNRTHYQNFDVDKRFTLSNALSWYDKEIVVSDASALTTPSVNGIPGVVWIEGERIEYFIKDGNSLKNLRRGTLGTGIKDVYAESTVGMELSGKNNIPYKDEVYTTKFTADGTSTDYTLDFTPDSVNEFDVFVAGKRMRKTTLDSYQVDNAMDSPEGDITLPAEFTVTNNILSLTTAPIENTTVVVVRKKGRTWSDPNKTLADSETDIAKFLRSTPVDLP